jgi:hypothetical protein
METLLAMGVFAVGFVAVASIFPVATLMQKQTAEDVLSQQVGRNAAAMMRARKFIAADLNDPSHPRYIPDDTRVHPLLKNDTDPPGQHDFWRLNDRSYFLVAADITGYYHPQHTAEIPKTNPYPSEFGRSYYWVPLIRRTQRIPTSPDDWQVFVFVLRGGGSPHPDHGYDRVGITGSPYNGWANYDGFTSPKWNVPGVYGMPVTVTAPDRFNFPTYPPDWPTNLYGKEAATHIQSTEHFEVQVGDKVLDNNGIIHTVGAADSDGVNVTSAIPTPPHPTTGLPMPPTILWYGRPGWEGKPSPTKAILILTDVVRP